MDIRYHSSVETLTISFILALLPVVLPSLSVFVLYKMLIDCVLYRNVLADANLAKDKDTGPYLTTLKSKYVATYSTKSIIMLCSLGNVANSRKSSFILALMHSQRFLIRCEFKFFAN